MTSGRKPHTQPQFDDIEKTIDQPRFANAMDNLIQEGKALSLAESQRVAAIRAVALQVGYQLPGDSVDPDLIQRDIATNMRRTAEAMLQVGIGLICLKEACQHGEFTARLGVLGFEPTVARRYMQVAKKLSNSATSRVLLNAIDSQSKLLELIVLDDEQIEELALNGEIGDLKRDDVNTMSVRELRAKVRELTDENKAKEIRIAVKSRQLDEAEEKLVRVGNLKPDEVLEELRKEALRRFKDVRADVMCSLRSALVAIDQHHRENGGDSLVFLSGLFGDVQNEMNFLRTEFGIVDVLPNMKPDFIRYLDGNEKPAVEKPTEH